MPDVKTAGDATELLYRAKQGDAAALEEFTGRNLGLVRMAVKRFIGRGVDYDDLFQIGCMGLVKAVENFDLNVGVQFSTYAVPAILGEIKRYLRDNGTIKVSRGLKEAAYKVMRARERLIAELGREPTISELSRESGVAQDELIMAMDSSLPVLSLSQPVDNGDELYFEGLIGEDNTDEVINSIAIKQAVEKLKPREQRLLRMRYFGGRTQKETAAALGISQVQVSRMEKAILCKMKRLIS